MQRPKIDGSLQDPVWSTAADIGPLRQVVPVADGTPTEDTRIRLLYDDNAVFVALECFDREPHLIRDSQRLRDARLNPDDRVEMIFDTFLDRRSGFWFQIGAGGSRGDALVTGNGSNFNKEWDGIWYGRAQVTSKGWQAEIEIPTATLNFDPEQSSWGFNIRRFIRRRNEEARWAAPFPRIGFFSIANAGTIHGISGLHQGLGLDFVPFAVTDYVRDRTSGRRYTQGDAGFDLFYKLTPNFKVSGTVNTDFAETEVDERRVNLTRFPLFFPEQRDFFLEDAGAFFFGPPGGGGGRADVIPFFSRRIGLDDDGNEVPLSGAIKVTGRTDSFSLGLIDVQTERDGELDDKNLFAGRFSKNLFEQSQVGVVWTRGNPTEDARNDTYGADFNYRTDTFLGDRNLRFSSYFLVSDTEKVKRNETAYFFRLDYPNDQVDLSASWSVIEDNFEPALGFVRRAGKIYRARAGWNPRVGGGIRQMFFRVEPLLITNAANHLATGEVRVRPLAIEFERGDEFSVDITRRTEVLDDVFEIQDDIFIPQERYDFTRYRVGFETASARKLALEADYEFGTFFNGRRADWSVEVNYRPTPLVNFNVEYNRNAVNLPGGDFVVRIWRGRMNLQFTPEIAWSNFVQYDSVSEALGLNSRLWVIVKPGHDLFFVINQGWEYSPDRFAPSSTQLTAKMSYTFRF